MIRIPRVQRCKTGLLVLVSCFAFMPNANGLDLVEVVAKAERSVVRVDTDAGFGSGVIVDDSGSILTNYHVIEGARQVTITLRSGKLLAAQGFLVADPTHDLALLKTDKFGDSLAMKVASALPKTGEKVAAFGNPKGFSFTTSEGIVSATRTGAELIEILGRDVYSYLGYAVDATWIQTTAPISAGNSGGPLVNMNAELIGLNTWSHTKGQNLNFAISLADINRLLNGKLDQTSPQKFANLPNLRAKPVGPPSAGPSPPAAGPPQEFKLELPNGRVFSFDVFSISAADFGKMSGANRDNTVSVRHPNGTIYAVASQEKGLLHGVTTAQWDNKQPMAYATYLAGKRHGVLKTWSESGKPILFGQYNQGKRHGFFCFFEDGNLRLLTLHKNDQLQWVQLISGEKALDGFGNRDEADRNASAHGLLVALDDFEGTLKTNEGAFRRRVREFEDSRRRAMAASLGPQKRNNATLRANQQAAESEAFNREFLRRALNGK